MPLVVDNKDVPSSCTLIFYECGRLSEEAMLNLIASALQGSKFCHVELAIGEMCGPKGEMKNVLRVFNDRKGVELVDRTGRNPSYTYISIGCSERSTNRMLEFARDAVGTPFSTYGMACSLMWPRITDGSSYFCAELVAACLKAGGLLDVRSNPGSATPSMLHRIYSVRGANC